jgi:hypothetical protein
VRPALVAAVAAMAAVVVLAACETAIDPRTGQTETRLTLPFTEANALRQREQWDRCVQFRSTSTCERTVPGGRPPGVPPDEDNYPEPPRRDP